MANTDVADELIERAAELLEEAAAELDGPGRVRRYEGFAESANAGGDPSPHFDHSPIFGMASPLAPPTRVEIGDDGRSVVLHVQLRHAPTRAHPARCTAASSPRCSTRCSA